MKKIFLLVSLICITLAGNAQTAASYSFSAFSDPFNSISFSPGATFYPSLWADDATELAVPIGFTFKYCGVNYTDLSICTNGWISLTNSPTSSWTNIETNIDGPGWLMPYWDDLDLTIAGDVFVETTGIAPSRVCTIEWNNVPDIGGTGTATFQIKLYESTDIIDFHYDLSSYFIVNATIGISNDAVSDWQTLSDETPTAVPL
jgi:hypothetical protein